MLPHPSGDPPASIPPATITLRRSKADIQANLLNEYAALNRHCSGKSPVQVLRETEVLLSAGLTFRVHTTDDNRQYVSVDGQRDTRWLPFTEGKPWSDVVHRDRANAPFITNGEESRHCALFFCAADTSAASSASTSAAPPPPALPEPAPGVPLPAPPVPVSVAPPPPAPNTHAPIVPLPGMTTLSDLATMLQWWQCGRAGSLTYSASSACQT